MYRATVYIYGVGWSVKQNYSRDRCKRAGLIACYCQFVIPVRRLIGLFKRDIEESRWTWWVIVRYASLLQKQYPNNMFAHLLLKNEIHHEWKMLAANKLNRYTIEINTSISRSKWKKIRHSFRANFFWNRIMLLVRHGLHTTCG